MYLTNFLNSNIEHLKLSKAATFGYELQVLWGYNSGRQVVFLWGRGSTSASKKNYFSSADLNSQHSINVMNSYAHAPTETKRYCVAIEQIILTYRHAYNANS